MDSVYKNIMAIAAMKGVTKKMDVADMIGSTPQKLTNWKTRGVPSAEYKNIADKLGVSVDKLLSKTGHVTNVEPAPHGKGDVPVLSWVQAGNAQLAIDDNDINEWVQTTCQVRRNTYALRVQGDSMMPMFTEGTILVIEPEIDYAVNDYVIAKNGDGEATFKQLVKDAGLYYLKPNNPQYPTVSLDGYTVIGVVREAIRKFK